jgi:hypothetical protein
MKRALLLLFGFCLTVISISCEKEKTPSDDRPIFSYSESIINPPDDFLILFNFVSIGENHVEVTFADSAVWMIEKLGNPLYNLSLDNFTTTKVIDAVDTLGLSANRKYKVIVKNVSTTEALRFFVGFKKLDIPYQNYPNRF